MMTIFLICMIPLAASFGFATCALLQAAGNADRQDEKYMVQRAYREQEERK